MPRTRPMFRLASGLTAVSLLLGGGLVASTGLADEGEEQVSEPNLEGFSLRQREFVSGQLRHFQRKIESFNRSCDAEVNASVDWQSFKEQIDLQLDGELNKSFHGYCSAGLSAAASMCRNSDAAKAAIRQRVQRYTCSYGTERAIRFQRNHLRMTIDWESANYDDWITDFLGRSL